MICRVAPEGWDDLEDCKTIRSGNPLLIVLLFLLKISPELSVGDLDRCRVYDVAYFGFRPVLISYL